MLLTSSVHSSITRPIIFLTAVVCFALSSSAGAQSDIRAKRQREIQMMLTFDSPQTTAGIRATCVSGREPNLIISLRAAGAVELPDAADYCVTALTRLGRNGTLGFVRDPKSRAVTPALAFDSGFVTAYRKNEPIPAGLPSMAALKPVAERCLAQSERDTELCQSAGYAYGVRAAQGEIVSVR